MRQPSRLIDYLSVVLAYTGSASIVVVVVVVLVVVVDVVVVVVIVVYLLLVSIIFLIALSVDTERISASKLFI